MDSKNSSRSSASARRSQTRCGAPVHKTSVGFRLTSAIAKSVGDGFPVHPGDRGRGFSDPPRGPLRLHRRRSPRIPADQRRRDCGLCSRNADARSQRFIFASSLAACRFPPTGSVLTESSPPDGDHIYARSKRMGEELLARVRDRCAVVHRAFCSHLLRLVRVRAAHVFVETWLSGAWNSRILGGRGESAIPISARPRAGRVHGSADPAQRSPRVVVQVLIASPNHTVSHRELFELVERYSGRWRIDDRSGCRRFLARLGVWGRDLLGEDLGNRPFETAVDGGLHRCVSLGGCEPYP